MNANAQAVADGGRLAKKRRVGLPTGGALEVSKRYTDWTGFLVRRYSTCLQEMETRKRRKRYPSLPGLKPVQAC